MADYRYLIVGGGMTADDQVAIVGHSVILDALARSGR